MQSDLAVQSRGNSFLIIWCYENFHALLLAACAGGVLALIALRSANPVITKGERAVLAAIGWLLALALAASYLGSVVFPNGWYQNSTALAAFAAAAVFLAAAQYAERDGYAPEAVMLILLLLPALASFGTDLPLQHRASFYAGWMLTAAALAIRRCRSRNLAAAGVAVVVIMTVLMTCQFFRHNICTHSRLSADRAAIPGTSLRVNPETAEQLAKLAAIRGNAKYLFSNDIQFWRFTLLGNFERPTRQFWPKPECLALDTLRPSDLILLEFPAKKLDQRRIAEIAERLGATSVRRTDLGGGLTAIQFPEAQP